MTSLMEKDCNKSPNGISDYKCASGKCVMTSGMCPRSSKCPSYSRDYYCPDTGWCESADYRCLRICGFNQSVFNYKYTCPGYPGLCASRSYYCPPACSSEETYKCLKKRQCAKGKNWCEGCFGKYRCQFDGKCISYFRKCDKFSDCSDGEDEVSCSYHDYDNLALDEWQLAGIVLGIFIIFFMCFYCCWKSAKTRASEEGASAGAASTSRNQQNRPGGPRVTGTTPAAVIRPPAVRVRNAYVPHLSTTARSIPPSERRQEYTHRPSDTSRSAAPSESGFYSPRLLPEVSGTPGAYPMAASAPRSYPEAANAISPEENQTFGPPPSYFDAIQNDELHDPNDPKLPTYEEVIGGTPADKQSFT
ncbi:low-density lipoprotein receptor-related protein 6-like isoform X2 [Lineus longissimus]|uniref:low-density lipoprotein receptor-related protein 6-like isoform X2 n=1 Tax=Lineus longissimus TaxID=88925 RepID=UPI002B4EF9C8